MSTTRDSIKIPLRFLWRQWRSLSLAITDFAKSLYCRFWYQIILIRLKTRSVERKVSILFLVNEPSKWKYHALYDLLVKNVRFDVAVALTVADIDWKLDREGRRAKYQSCGDFFRSRGYACRDAYDVEHDCTIPLVRLRPDVVFYQQPWRIDPSQQPSSVCRCALTFYVPYFVPTFVDLKVNACQTFHKTLFAHIVINDAIRKFYQSKIFSMSHCEKILSLGHPMVDEILRKQNTSSQNEKDGSVIYAPHWSVPSERNVQSLNLSTFLIFGEYILEFAERNKDIHWVFKPHPSLKSVLLRGIWDRHRVEEYYARWESIGEASYTGDYSELFASSRLMITDCDSFLSEYGMTAKPIIHLIGPGYGRRKYSPFKEVFETYYQVYSKYDLQYALDKYLLQMQDPNKDKRSVAIAKVGLNDGGCAARIYDYMVELVTKK